MAEFVLYSQSQGNHRALHEIALTFCDVGSE